MFLLFHLFCMQSVFLENARLQGWIPRWHHAIITIHLTSKKFSIRIILMHIYAGTGRRCRSIIPESRQVSYAAHFWRDGGEIQRH